MEHLLRDGLRFGYVVEVPYSVRLGKYSDQVWWAIRVEKLTLVEDRRGSTLQDSLKFQVLYGFPATSQEFIFQPDQKKRDRDGVLFSWRFLVEHTSSSKSGFSSAGSCGNSSEDVSDESFEQDAGSGNIKRKVSNVALDGSRGKGGLEKKRKLYRLESTLELSRGTGKAMLGDNLVSKEAGGRWTKW